MLRNNFYVNCVEYFCTLRAFSCSSAWSSTQRLEGAKNIKSSFRSHFLYETKSCEFDFFWDTLYFRLMSASARREREECKEKLIINLFCGFLSLRPFALVPTRVDLHLTLYACCVNNKIRIAKYAILQT